MNMDLMTCFGVVIGLLCALDEREGNVGCGEGPPIPSRADLHVGRLARDRSVVSGWSLLVSK